VILQLKMVVCHRNFAVAIINVLTLKSNLIIMRNIKEIIIHCTATPAGRDVTAKDVDLWHRQRGFKCIGYHYLVRLDGSVEVGRAETDVGAHCLGHNRYSIGVAYVGGIGSDGKACDTRTDSQRQSLLTLLQDLKRRYPGAAIHGHRDFAAKDCPCFDATTEYLKL
jgi:N-acetylmuramoyl-L-alanine amidase